MLNALISLLFPKLCAACAESLLKDETHICTQCLVDLPKAHTGMHDSLAGIDRFVLLPQIVEVKAFYKFTKSALVQNILHEIKYKGNDELAIFMGKAMAKNWQFSFENAILVPVPLYSKKELTRGFNQSERLAFGLSESTGIPINKTLVKRIKPTETQTKKSRTERYENVEGVFVVEQSGNIQDKTIILVDDVLTTGATIEMCARALVQVGVKKIVVVVLAIAV